MVRLRLKGNLVYCQFCEVSCSSSVIVFSNICRNLRKTVIEYDGTNEYVKYSIPVFFVSNRSLQGGWDCDITVKRKAILTGR